MRALARMRMGILVLALGLASCKTPVAEMSSRPAGADGNAARGDVVSFHERAAARTAAGVGPERDVDRYKELARYRIECSLEMPSGNYFTLARADDGRAALFAWTATGPVRNLQKAIEVGTYSRLFSAVPGLTSDWGWLYDRNGDGWVDYFTYVDGAMPVMADDIAPLVPKKPGAKPGQAIKLESTEELQLIVRGMQLVFTHHADDNFDGRSDAVVAALHYPENPMWTYRYGVLRSRAFTQVIDEDWSFESHIGMKAGSVPRENGLFQVSFFRSGDRALETSSEMLARINDGLRACRIPKGELPRE